MSAGQALVVNSRLAIPRHELEFRASRSGGPGGQHVNTSATRIELLWNVERSTVLSPEQRERLKQRLAARLDGEGTLRVVSSAFRSQLRNRVAAEERLAAMIRSALAVQKPRKKTRPPRVARENRLKDKRRRAELKRGRGRVRGQDDG